MKEEQISNKEIIAMIEQSDDHIRKLHDIVKKNIGGGTTHRKQPTPSPKRNVVAGASHIG